MENEHPDASPLVQEGAGDAERSGMIAELAGDDRKAWNSLHTEDGKLLDLTPDVFTAGVLSFVSLPACWIACLPQKLRSPRQMNPAYLTRVREARRDGLMHDCYASSHPLILLISMTTHSKEDVTSHGTPEETSLTVKFMAGTWIVENGLSESVASTEDCESAVQKAREAAAAQGASGITVLDAEGALQSTLSV